MENVAREVKKGSQRLLIISFDVIGKQMAGPGIRFYEFARVLSNYIDVTLATPNRIDISTDGFKTLAYDLNNYRALKRVSELSDIILIQGHILHYFPFLKNFRGKIIVDLYNPFNLESLEMFRNEKIAERLRIDRGNLDLLKFQVSIGDFFICASEKQKSYWLGMLGAMGRLNPYSYDNDDTFKNLINIVPFGIPSSPPKHTGESVRKLIPAIKEDDSIILWGGGIWNWLDPVSVIKAMWEITRSRKDIKLVFVGIRHPDPKLPGMRKSVEAVTISRELDLYDKFVFFNEWVPYEMRQNFLLESTAGLSIHHEKVETEFAYRTRVMDYIWAKLPIITTEGDSIAKMVKTENIGEVIKYENINQLARVMESMASNRSLRDIYVKNLEKMQPRFYWENVTEPLVEYCCNPEYAADKKKIMELLETQNSKIINVLKNNFSGTTNILVITSNLYADKGLLKEEDLGKIFYLELKDFPVSEEKSQQQDKEEAVLDEIGFLKSKILSRTRFDGVIINNTFSAITPKFFYDLLNVIAMKLRSDGILFFSIPENRGILRMLSGEIYRGRTTDRMDEFTMEYILKNAGYEIIEKGVWDKIEAYQDSDEPLKNKEELLGELYGKDELTDLFEIKLSRQDFKDLNFLKSMNILESDEFISEKNIKNKIKKYLYSVTGLYLENLRKSYNISMNAINNNIQVQINREMNEINARNRERMLIIYYSIFKTLQYQISNFGIDLRALRKFIEESFSKSERELTSLDERLEVLLGDMENIDRIMGLTLSNKYFVAKKI
ncbi:MAG: glycosyltransferase family 4 protein [Actinobacteria bacterium]|nr:glycosyltransferase family 4 protein [Actinomycetota bacterium]